MSEEQYQGRHDNQTPHKLIINVAPPEEDMQNTIAVEKNEEDNQVLTT